MEPSRTEQFVALLNEHAARLLEAAQDDWQLSADRFARGEEPLHFRDTHVARLDALLRPTESNGPFFKGCSAAVKECAEYGQLAAFQPVFERTKLSYGRAWDRARRAFASDERLDGNSPEIGALTHDIAEIQDLLPALDIGGSAAPMITRGPHETEPPIGMTGATPFISAGFADRTLPMSVAEIAIFIFGEEARGDNAENKRRQVRDWMQKGKLQAEQVQAGYIVSQKDIETLRSIYFQE